MNDTTIRRAPVARPTLLRLHSDPDPEPTEPQRIPRCTIIGMPPPERLPATPTPTAVVASYVTRYPPHLDEVDAIVVDVDFDPVGKRVTIGRPR